MIVILHAQGLKTLVQVQAFVSSNGAISFTLTDRVAAYGWMTEAFWRDIKIAPHSLVSVSIDDFTGGKKRR